jgi:dTDP-4-dehydrorhamnose reductase
MIWLVGDKGMLGSEVRRGLDAKSLACVSTDKEVDVTDVDALRAFSSDKGITWIINCAAYTAVDKAEEEPQAAHALNARAPENLACLAKEKGAKIVHISTDYVFDGKATTPYRESDPTGPLGIYGQTKADGEELVRKCCPESFIIRSAWLYGRDGNNFVHTMLKLMTERERVRVVADQWGSPTCALDLSNAILSIVASGKEEYGIYNYSNEGETTWYGFAVALKEEAIAAGFLSSDCIVEPVDTSQYPTKARRPAYSVLSKEKIKQVFDIAIPHWRTSLHCYLRESFSALRTI